MKITVEYTSDGKMLISKAILAKIGLRAGAKVTVGEIKEKQESGQDKQESTSVIGLLDKYRTVETPTATLEDMENAIAQGANRGRFK